MGVANERSIAWGISQKLSDNGADLAFTYLGDIVKKRVSLWQKSVNSNLVLSCNVENKEEIKNLFEDIKKKWGKLDFVVHAIAFSDKNELNGEYLNTTREIFLKACRFLVFHLQKFQRKPLKLWEKDLVCLL